MKLLAHLPLMLCLTIVIMFGNSELVAEDTFEQRSDHSSVSQSVTLLKPPPGPYRSIPNSNRQFPAMNKQARSFYPGAPAAQTPSTQAMMMPPVDQRVQMPRRWAPPPAISQQPERAQQSPIMDPRSYPPPNWVPRQQYSQPPNRWQQQWGQQRPQTYPVPNYPPQYRMPGPNRVIPNQPPAAYWQQPNWAQRPPMPGYQQDPAGQGQVMPPPQPVWRYGPGM